ncbi:MAG: RidA family protein [Chloroflexaceae bacterium]|nr:RidA family protein [Chloroflexaceae bacterium]
MSSRTVIHTSNAPEPVGPYSQAIRTDSLVFLAGQVALDPATGELIDGDVQAQTRQVLENLKAVLAQAGSALERVVKTTVFLADIADFAAMNAIYGEYFTNEPPARSAFQVAALPKGAARKSK